MLAKGERNPCVFHYKSCLRLAQRSSWSDTRHRPGFLRFANVPLNLSPLGINMLDHREETSIQRGDVFTAFPSTENSNGESGVLHSNGRTAAGDARPAPDAEPSSNSTHTQPAMSLKHITRLDYQKTHGWWVRIRRKSNPCSKLFSDGVYGGREKALEAAIAWRDEKLAHAPKQAIRTTESSSKTVKTGVPGLCVSFVSGSSGNLAHLQVSVQRHDKRTSTRYSISKWGLRAALWKSCVALARGSLKNAEDRVRLQQEAIKLFDKAYGNVAKSLDKAGCVYEP